MASGYFTMYQATGDDSYKEKGMLCLDWLMEHKSPLYRHYSWSNHFDFASRSGRYTKDESIIVWTSLIGQAFLEGFEIAGKSVYLDVAKSVCEWILNLPRERTDRGVCLSYLANQRSFIHNSNMLGAALLAKTWRITGQDELLDVAKAAMEYSCARQQADGSWCYGEAENQQWIDNFHTGYNLDSLKHYIEGTGDTSYSLHLDRGFIFYRTHFFEETGRPKYYHDRAYPIDSQCAAQAIETLANFSDLCDDSLNLSVKVAVWWIKNMQDADGHFYYRQYPLRIRAKTPMLHWAQATTYKALALLLLKAKLNVNR